MVTLNFKPDVGTYTNTTLIHGGVEYPAGEIYYWKKRRDGTHRIFIRKENIPAGVDLADARVRVQNRNHVTLIEGDVVGTPSETLGHNYTLIVGPPLAGKWMSQAYGQLVGV